MCALNVTASLAACNCRRKCKFSLFGHMCGVLDRVYDNVSISIRQNCPYMWRNRLCVLGMCWACARHVNRRAHQGSCWQWSAWSCCDGSAMNFVAASVAI